MSKKIAIKLKISVNDITRLSEIAATTDDSEFCILLEKLLKKITKEIEKKSKVMQSIQDKLTIK